VGKYLKHRFLVLFLVTVLVSGNAFATVDQYGVELVPPNVEELERLHSTGEIAIDESGEEFDIRMNAMKEAGLSLGARAGLSWRTYWIRKEMESRATHLDKVFDFRNLLIPAPSGLLIEPPVVSEAINSLIIQGGGQTAAVADRVYNINANARIVSTSRSWRNYLEREWGEVKPPPDLLLPKNATEQKKWVQWVNEGWEKGIEQANDIFQEDLNQLTADFQGMVRYRILLTQGMISPPYAMQVDRGVTGGGSEMRVGDRAVQITGTSELITGSERWQPASR
jgi:defect-in-organelle-trafficking protein DotC